MTTTMDSARDWRRRVWRLAIPIMLGTVSTPLLGLVDTAVVGHLESPHYLGAVAIGSLIFNFLFWGFGFLRMSTTGLTAQAVGAGAEREAGAILTRALALAAGFGLLLILLQTPISAAALALIDSSGDVESGASTYIAVRIWAAPATLANYAILGFLLGRQRPGLALAIQLVLNGTNIALDLYFVLGMGWNVAGVAAASVLAEFVALGAGLLLVRRVMAGPGVLWHVSALKDRLALRRLVTVNGDIFVRTLCLVGGFGWFTAQGAEFGEIILAANAILLNFQTFTGYALDGFAHAAEALVGQAIGARDRRALGMAVRASTLLAAVTACLFSLLYLVAGPLVIDGLTGIESVRQAAREYLPWVVALPVVSVWAFQWDGVFLGAVRTAALRNAMIVSLLSFLAISSVLVPWGGNHGLWAAFTIFAAMRGVTLTFAYPALRRAV